MALPSIAIIVGFLLLIWSADRFVDGAAGTAKHLGVPSLLIGMIVVGFGTSAPEMVVSVIAAMDGNPQLALGNALGSNIVNIGLILGITAIISPIMVQSIIIKKELPLLMLITLLLGGIIWNNSIERYEALILFGGFLLLVGWSIYSGLKNKDKHLEEDMDNELESKPATLSRSVMHLVIGLIFLVISSRILVWGAVSVAQSLGVSDLVIGLTIVAIGTSLPELAASIVAARKGEHDIAIGNIVGSNMFNILAVIGIAGVIAPIPEVPVELFNRDWLSLLGMTLALFVMAYGFGRQGRINRFEGALLLIGYCGYNAWLLLGTV